MKLKQLAIVFSLGLGLVLPNISSAAVITYVDFSDVTGLQFNGDATTSGNDLLLTSGLNSAGSVFSNDSIVLDANLSFSAFFSFNISNNIGRGDTDGSGADGLVFALQTVSNTAGSEGGGIGFRGLNESLGIEFDTYNNGAQDDSNGNHIGVNLNGDVDSISQYNESTRFNNGEDWFAWIDYNGVTDELTVRYNTVADKPLSAAISETIDLTSIFGSNDVFVGFTSGTGGYGSDHKIDSLSFSTVFDNDFANEGLVEASSPATLGIFGLSIFGIALHRRRLSAKA